MRFIILLAITFSISNSSMYLGAKGFCIERFWISNQNFIYEKSETLEVLSSPDLNLVKSLSYGFTYDSILDECSPSESYILGLESTQYNFLMALSGLLFSFLLFYIVSVFLLGL